MIVQFLFQFRPISGIPGKLVFNKHFTKVAALTSSVGKNEVYYQTYVSFQKFLYTLKIVKTYKIHMLYSTLNF